MKLSIEFEGTAEELQALGETFDGRKPNLGLRQPLVSGFDLAQPPRYQQFIDFADLKMLYPFDSDCQVKEYKFEHIVHRDEFIPKKIVGLYNEADQELIIDRGDIRVRSLLCAGRETVNNYPLDTAVMQTALFSKIADADTVLDVGMMLSAALVFPHSVVKQFHGDKWSLRVQGIRRERVWSVGCGG